jgi:Arc/MetJ-type ribon-helix-helix transcriptional regulator
MATRKPVSLPLELAKAVEDYRFANRFKTESDAIRRLIELGLKVAKTKAGKTR